ncbi:MAG: acyl-CoA dehydrogenase family protein, partial [Gemmatimonadota bacterium]|nr:acyl-CoA dehydrogenase family protein [Gemmatimonadota bacterium]
MQDFPYFTEEHHQIREMVREFAENEIRPVAKDLDAGSTFPWDNVKKMAELGLLGAPWPEDLEGAGLDYLSYVLIVEELARVDASHSITVSAHTTLGTSPIINFGTEEQKKRFVPHLASGRVLGGFGLTEPGAGSDAGGTATVAEEKGDHYVLNGSKIFITHAGVGEIFVVTARTDTNPVKRNHGITSFVVTKDTVDLDAAAAVGIGHLDDLPKIAGVSSGKKEDKMGWRA